MLKQRLLTAGILIPVFICIIFLTPPFLFFLIIGLVTLGASLEILPLLGVNTSKSRLICVAVILIVGTMMYLLNLENLAVVAGVIWWCLQTLRLNTNFTVDSELSYRAEIHPIVACLTAIITLVPAWLSVSLLRDQHQGAIWVLVFFLIVGIADSAAYFSGRAFGNHKLAPAISPGKTREGLYGALVCGLICAVLAGGYWLDIRGGYFWIWCLLAIAVILFSVVGDLAESKLKRAANVKDSGTLLPGHGGILDRVDGVLAAAPLFVFGAMFLLPATV